MKIFNDKIDIDFLNGIIRRKLKENNGSIYLKMSERTLFKLLEADWYLSEVFPASIVLDDKVPFRRIIFLKEEVL